MVFAIAPDDIIKLINFLVDKHRINDAVMVNELYDCYIKSERAANAANRQVDCPLLRES
jgi:hypothetical protein